MEIWFNPSKHYMDGLITTFAFLSAVKLRRGNLLTDFEFRFYLDYVRHFVRGLRRSASNRPTTICFEKPLSCWFVEPHILWHHQVGPKWSSALFNPKRSNAVWTHLSSLPPPQHQGPLALPLNRSHSHHHPPSNVKVSGQILFNGECYCLLRVIPSN
jgi:hypothetical protein